MENREHPTPENTPEPSGAERIEIFEGLKQEMITQGLAVVTPEQLVAFDKRARAFIASDAPPSWIKHEMLRILETQSRTQDVKAVVRDLQAVVREEMLEDAGEDRVAEMEEVLKLGGTEQSQIGNRLMEEIERFLKQEAMPRDRQELWDEAQHVGDSAVRDVDLRKMREELEQNGTGVVGKAEEFLKRETGGKN